MSVLLTFVLLAAASQLATRLKQTGQLPADHHQSIAAISIPAPDPKP